MPDSSLTLSAASGSLLQKADLPGKQGNVLLIKHPGVSWPAEPCMERNQQSFDRAIHLNLGNGKERYSGLACRSNELPFIEASFRLVVLWHVLGAGTEVELAEACRVLAAGGDLLILGLQHNRFSVPVGWQNDDLPILRRRQVLQQLKEAGMRPLSSTGMGLPLNSGLVLRQSGAGRVLLPLARLLMVHARHGRPAIPSPLQLAGFRAGVAPTS